MADAPKPRWYRLTPDRLVLILLAVEGLLWLSERFQLFPKGYAVLIAVASVGVFLLAMLLWFILALLFRLRFQYNIRSLLLLTVAVAIPCSWLAVEREKARKQREAVEEIRKEDGSVEYDYQNTPSGRWIQGAIPPGPAWLRRLLGADFFANVITITGDEITDAGLEHIKCLAQLQSLNLFGANVSDAGLEHIKGMTSIQDLRLDGVRLTDAGLQHIEGLTQLRTLWLGDTQVGDAGLEHLKGLTRLQWLKINGTQVSDAGLEHLKGLTQLQWLDLNNTQVGDAGIQKIRGLTHLHEVNLEDTNVSDAGLEHLKGLTQLKDIYLCGPYLTDADVKKLRKSLPNCHIH